MSQLDKLLDHIRNHPNSVRFAELNKILRHAGFERRQPRSGSSHYTYFKGNKLLTVPKHKPYIKEIYVVRALVLLQGEEI